MFNLKYEPFEAFATIRDAFLPHEIEIIKNLIKSSEKEKGIVGSANNTFSEIKDIRDSYIKWLNPDQNTQWIFEKISAIVNEFNLKFFGMDLTQTEAIQLTEYDSKYQGFYGQHCDNAYGMKDTRNRKLSLTMQLSKPEEYEGGDLRLYINSFKTFETASRDYGSLTLFRSHIIHEVMPVTKGTRYSLVTWVNGPLFK